VNRGYPALHVEYQFISRDGCLVMSKTAETCNKALTIKLLLLCRLYEYLIATCGFLQE